MSLPLFLALSLERTDAFLLRVSRTQGTIRLPSSLHSTLRGCASTQAQPLLMAQDQVAANGGRVRGYQGPKELRNEREKQSRFVSAN